MPLITMSFSFILVQSLALLSTTLDLPGHLTFALVPSFLFSKSHETRGRSKRQPEA